MVELVIVLLYEVYVLSQGEKLLSLNAYHIYSFVLNLKSFLNSNQDISKIFVVSKTRFHHVLTLDLKK